MGWKMDRDQLEQDIIKKLTRLIGDVNMDEQDITKLCRGGDWDLEKSYKFYLCGKFVELADHADANADIADEYLHEHGFS